MLLRWLRWEFIWKLKKAKLEVLDRSARGRLRYTQRVARLSSHLLPRLHLVLCLLFPQSSLVQMLIIQVLLIRSRRPRRASKVRGEPSSSTSLMRIHPRGKRLRPFHSVRLRAVALFLLLLRKTEMMVVRRCQTLRVVSVRFRRWVYPLILPPRSKFKVGSPTRKGISQRPRPELIGHQRHQPIEVLHHLPGGTLPDLT